MAVSQREATLPRVGLRMPTPPVLDPPLAAKGLRRAGAGLLFVTLFVAGAYFTQSSALGRVPAPEGPLPPSIPQAQEMMEPWYADADAGRGGTSATVASYQPMMRATPPRPRPAPTPPMSTLRVLATAYTSEVGLTDDTPHLTATNSDVREGIIALSQDLLRSFTPGAPFDYGDMVEVKNVGRFRIEDTMHPRWQKRADIWFPTREQAVHWGARSVTLKKVQGQPAKP